MVSVDVKHHVYLLMITLSSLTGASSSVQQDASWAEGTSDDDAMDTDEEAQLLESDLDEFSDDDKDEKKDDGMGTDRCMSDRMRALVSCLPDS